MAMLCKNFKSESQVVWIWEAFLPLCNLVVDIVYTREEKRREEGEFVGGTSYHINYTLTVHIRIGTLRVL